jgi:hypothetical protein
MTKYKDKNEIKSITIYFQKTIGKSNYGNITKKNNAYEKILQCVLLNSL